MQLLQHFHELSLHPANANELKGLILQLALQGKLTSQWRLENSDLESAKKLLELIQDEKEKLIFKKKIRKEKPPPLITENEFPYLLPEKWEWCRLQDYLDVRDGTHDTPKYVENGIPLVTSKNLYTKKLNMTNIKFISEKDHQEISKRSFVEKYDILFAMIGSIGNPVIVDIEPNFSIKNVALIKYFIKEICVPKYILFFLEKVTEEFKEDSDGAVQAFVSLKKLRLKEFPLPPLEEQKAIVEVVEQLFKEVEQLEQLTKKRIQLKEKFVISALRDLTTNNTIKERAVLQPHFHTFFNEEPNIKKLRESILQLAVQGKLTAHWRSIHSPFEGGTGDVKDHDSALLLEKIKEEKAQLIKDKKIKNVKPFPFNSNEANPFLLPKGWMWCRFQDITVNRDGKRIPISKEDRKIRQGEYDYYGASGVIDKIDEYLFDKDLLLIGEDGANLINRSTPIAFFARGKYWVNNHAHVIDSPFFTVLEYLEKYINAINLEEYITGMAQPKMPQKRMNIINVSLPPLKEQEAIVETINRLMVLCDKLEQEVKLSKDQVEMWMKGVLREVLEVN